MENYRTSGRKKGNMTSGAGISVHCEFTQAFADLPESVKTVGRTIFYRVKAEPLDAR
jgi:hypothetical protein